MNLVKAWPIFREIFWTAADEPREIETINLGWEASNLRESNVTNGRARLWLTDL
jgi:hypothetical protein